MTPGAWLAIAVWVIAVCLIVGVVTYLGHCVKMERKMCESLFGETEDGN